MRLTILYVGPLGGTYLQRGRVLEDLGNRVIYIPSAFRALKIRLAGVLEKIFSPRPGPTERSVEAEGR